MTTSRVFLALFLLAAGALPAQDAGVAQTVRAWIDVRDAKGRIPGDLGPDDLQIVNDGGAVALERLDAEGPRRREDGAEPTRLVLYFDQALASKGTLRRASETFAALAPQLAELGTVEIVMADDAEARTVLESRDELVIAERLNWTLLDDDGDSRLLAIRERALADLARLRDARANLRPSAQSDAAAAAEIASAAVDEELDLLKERRDVLLAWLGRGQSSGASGPRLLLYVADGFDLDPLSFYSPQLGVEAVRQLVRSAPRALALEGAWREVAKALAASGWTVMPVRIAGGGGSRAVDPTNLELGDPTTRTTTGAGVTIHPGSIFKRRRDEPSEPAGPVAALLDPQPSVEILAEQSGGEVVTGQSALQDALERFSRRFEIEFRLPASADGTPRPLDVEAARPGLTVTAPRWTVAGLPDAVRELRLRQLLRGEEVDEGLVVEAAVDPDGSTLDARVDLRELRDEDEDYGTGDFQVTIGVAVPGEDHLRVERRRLADQNVDGLEEWAYSGALDLPAGVDEVAVMVEELGLKRWGGVRAAVLRGGLDQLLPAPLVVEIERPDDEVLRGRVKFETAVYDRRVARVVFFLDDDPVAEADHEPFSARVDLGRNPHRQNLSVVAYAADGSQLGRDSALINAGSGGLEVKIVRPTDFRGSGPVDVEASIAVPVERRLDRVLFFWKNQTVATLFAPPFVSRINVPSKDESGYIRVVAMLDDGTTAEDIVFVNGPRHGERLDVNLVELYVVVTDADGRPVRGLTEDQFEIREDGEDQPIATFSDASDLPLTLGMAIDSSASMFVKLPTVQQAASQFLRSTFGENDRAFLVDFDSEPRLALATTGQLERVVGAIDRLEAGGRTALWESIVYSLLQLQGVKGRKALIVYSDGADEDEDFTFGSCLKIAKRMGVPIYLILMRKQPDKDSAGLSLLVRSFSSRVERLVHATGGRVFYAKEYQHLDDVYAEIEQELRSQYLLTYYPSEPSKGWRKVDVEVAARGLTPRTLSGYWQ